MAQNPLFNLLQGNMQGTPVNGLLGQIEAFRKNFHGDPKQQIQQMLNSGRVSQAQYNQAVQTANALMRILSGKM